MEDRDFIDFKFGDHWASEFNLVAVSSGDRYSPPVYGSVNPNTTTVAGKVGVYKWKSQIGEKVFNINIAFDNINGQTLNQIKEWLHPFKIDKLTFKEEPFKYYWVTLNSEPELNFVPFLEETKVVNGIEFKQGIYKGEFNIQFVCFDNYGYSDWQSFDENYDYLAEVINSTNGVISVNDAMNVETEIGIQGVSRQETRAAEEGKTVEGEMISLSDVDVTKEHTFTIQGNLSQETREGYNLLDVSSIETKTINGVAITKNSDNSITMNGTATANFGINVSFNKTLPAGKYTHDIGTDIPEKVYFSLDSSSITMLQKSTGKKISFELTTEKTYTNYLIWMDTGAVIDNITVFPMIYSGTEEKEYEQYGAMPSFLFPSPVKSVTGDIEIEICNKNLAKISDTLKLKQNKDNIEVLSAINGATITNISLEAGEYIVSLVMLSKPTSSTTFSNYLDAVNITNNDFYNVNNLELNKVYTKKITLTKQTQLSYRIWGNENADLFKFQFQIKKGTVATDFTPHQSQTYPLYLDKELHGDETVRDSIVKKDGKWYYKFNWGKRIFDGTENFTLQNNAFVITQTDALKVYYGDNQIRVLSNYFMPQKSEYRDAILDLHVAKVIDNDQNQIGMKYSATETVEEFKAKLVELHTAGNPLYIIYQLAEPIYEEITDETLIAQLDALENSTLYQGTTHISSEDNINLHYNYLTPIPSIKFPSEIQNTEEKVDIQICNKNLIPFGYDKGYIAYYNGITVEVLDEHRIKINGTATNNFSFDYLLNDYIYYKKGVFYTLSCNKVSGSFSNQLLIHTSFVNDTQNLWGYSQLLLKEDKASITFQPEEDGYSPRLIVYVQTGFSFDNLIIEIQLEQGKTATEYVDHQSQTVTFPLSEGQKLYEGSYLAEDGIHNTRKQYIFTGEEYITTIDSGTRLCTSSKRVAALNEIKINTPDYAGNLSNVLSNCFEVSTQGQVVNSDNYMAFSQWGEDKYIYFSAANRTIEGLQALFKERYENGTPIMIEYELEEEEVIPYTQEQEEALKNIYLYTGINNIYVDNAELALTYIPQQNIYIDYMVNCSNLLNDSSFYHDNDIYKKSYFDIDTGDATKSGISTDRPVYLYNAGTSRANLNLTFDLIIPAEDSPLTIKTESCKLTDNDIQILNEESLISISNFANFKPFLDIYDGNLDNWQIEIDSELCEVYVKHKIDKTKIISLNKFNDEQSFLSLANCKFVDYLKPFPTSITAISNSAIENTIFNKLSVASSAQNYRLKNVYVDWKHTYI